MGAGLVSDATKATRAALAVAGGAAWARIGAVLGLAGAGSAIVGAALHRVAFRVQAVAQLPAGAAAGREALQRVVLVGLAAAGALLLLWLQLACLIGI